MREYVFFLYAKQPHYDSFTMVPVQGMSGTKAFFKEKIEPYFDACVKADYKNVYCEVRMTPIVEKLVLNMGKTEIIKNYNERVGDKWTKRKLQKQ
ncbi:MAG: hypothetical protein NC218_03565 [Acetobacter sp.]|nr:hypothetical protein [Acetobacter sp.]